MKNAKLYILILLCGMALNTAAENKWAYLNMRHEVRMGWGDQLFESLMWHNPVYRVRTMPASYTQLYHENYHHDQHIWAEYQYREKGWFSFGGMADISFVHWDDVTRNGLGEEIARTKGHYFYNLVIMPTIRFTYFHHEFVNLYSGLGFGMDINGGTETDGLGRKTVVGAAANITVIGVSANYNRWFWTVDFGGMYALRNANTIFMLSSRIINVGFGARF
ncbi:MAG: hypothetical protein IKS76_03055 [Paludibacteraceae bacterium]|nr:hypothetical protein [Paludibacteraceae bacterium]